MSPCPVNLAGRRAYQDQGGRDRDDQDRMVKRADGPSLEAPGRASRLDRKGRNRGVLHLRIIRQNSWIKTRHKIINAETHEHVCR